MHYFRAHVLVSYHAQGWCIPGNRNCICHLQVPSSRKGDPCSTSTWQWGKAQTIHCEWYRLDKTTGQSVYHQIQAFQGPIPLSKSETDSKNQSVEDRIPITLGPTLLDDTPDTTRLEVDDSLTDPSSSGAALSRIGPAEVVWCATALISR